MANLKTSYMGIELKNPIIVGANNLNTNPSFLREAEANGAAAVVYKSLFEEQLHLEEWKLSEDLEAYADRHAEMTSLFPKIEHAGPKEFLEGLKTARKALSIPLFASLNCTYKESWEDYAKLLAATGVDGLELNFYAIPSCFDKTAEEVENEQVEVLKRVKAAINIPVAIKLSPYYSSPLNFIKKLDEAGADSVVLFNRLFQPEINVDSESNVFNWNMSGKRDSRLSLRFAGLLFDNIEASIVASNGVLDSNIALQMLLAGADAVQVVSAIYQNKVGYIGTMLDEIEAWMDKKGYQSITDFKGNMSRKNTTDNFAYKRAQYIDLLINSTDVMEKYDLV